MKTIKSLTPDQMLADKWWNEKDKFQQWKLADSYFNKHFSDITLEEMEIIWQRESIKMSGLKRMIMVMFSMLFITIGYSQPYIDLNIGGSSFETGKFISTIQGGIMYKNLAVEAHYTFGMITNEGVYAGYISGTKPFTNYFFAGVTNTLAYKAVKAANGYYDDIKYRTYKPTIGYKWSWGAGDFMFKYMHKAALEITVGFQLREIIKRI